MKDIKRVQIVIRDDDSAKNSDGVIFDFYRSVKRATVFLKEFGIIVTEETLYHLWKQPDLSKSEISFGIQPEFHEKLMNSCPVNKRLPLNHALDKDSACFGILPFVD